MELDSFLRQSHPAEKERRARPEWLPPLQIIREHVSIEESGEVARDIFHRWVQKIRRATPTIHAPSF